MTTRNQALALNEQLAKMGHALSSPQRLRLLNLLCQSERTVETIAEAMSLSIATVSHHLQQLRRARLIVARKIGRFVTADARSTVAGDHPRQRAHRLDHHRRRCAQSGG